MKTKLLFFFLVVLSGVNMFSQSSYSVPTVSINPVAPVCNPGDCVDLSANYSQVKTTTTYTVQSINYNPPAADFTPFEDSSILDNVADDQWSPIFDLPFDFCFYGQYYNKVLVGSNGVITFDIAGVVPGGVFSPGPGCPWSFSTSIPNVGFPVKRAIYGVYQDTDIREAVLDDDSVPNDIQRVNYKLFGTAPQRYLVVSFNELPQFDCHASVGLQSSQIVIYETSNIIEVYVKDRTPCPSWQGGVGVIGIQNESGTIAHVPPGRNTGNWSASEEAWRFLPAGPVNTSQISWLEDGNLIPGSEGASQITVCPTVSTTYTAVVKYRQCNNVDKVITDSIVVAPEPFPLTNEPEGIIICTNDAPPYYRDIDQTAYMLGTIESFYYNITYHNTLTDAENGAPFIDPAELLNYEIYGPETIYVRIEDLFGNGCVTYTSFDIIIQAPPSGSISYSDSTFCDTDTNVFLPSNTAPTGGNYVVTPATGLNLDPSTGEITPNGSQPGTYDIVYHLDASGSCPAYDTPAFTVEIEECCKLDLISATGTDGQVICLGDSIIDIEYETVAQVTSVDVQGLPLGVSYSYINELVTISGTPTEIGVFTYSVETIGCSNNIIKTGTITITGVPLTPVIDSVAPTCSSDEILTINNYNSSFSYTFDPVGPAIDTTTGEINGMVVGTTYTVYATSGSCVSPLSDPFSMDEMLTTPDVPTISIIAATCSSDGESIITNVDPSLTYIFSPTGPTVDPTTGEISGMVLDTPYTVYVNNGDCDSVVSTSFTNDTMLSIPNVPTISTIAATCSSDGESTITNIDSSLTYVFSPTGPTVDLTTGVISGMVTTTLYTVHADNGSCTSAESTSFSIDEMLTTPDVPTISTIAATCSSDGESTITNVDPLLTYIFSPTGPTVDPTTGEISGMVLDTTYTVYANNGDCDSAASASFTNDTMLVTPVVPVISTTSATCSSDGESTITNIDPSLTYVFSPTGPTVDLTTGVISGMVLDTPYTVHSNNGDCDSAASVSFTNDTMLVTPAVPVISTASATCSSDGESTITNIDPSLTYVFSPTGPTVDLTTGVISGMVVGTSYTVYSGNASCNSGVSASFTNDTMLVTPVVPVISTTSATCSSDGESTITNIDPSLTYVFSPTGPTVDLTTGVISGMVLDTPYTVHSNNGDCDSAASASFTNDTMLVTPAVPVISTASATCSSDGESTITNIDPSLTYVFSPTGPTVDLTTGVLSGMVVGTSYTVYSGNASCNSGVSASFTNDTMLVTPVVPVISTTSATCSSDGESTITNIDPSLTYVFSPTGPTVDLTTGVISGMVLDTPYTVHSNNGDCDSAASASFTNDTMLVTPAVPVISTASATCSSDGESTITNIDPSLTYVFSPTGPTVDLTTGVISGMVVGTSYTVYAGHGSCSSTLSSGFVNDPMQSNPTFTGISNGGVICSGNTADFYLQGTPGANVLYSVNGGSNVTIPLDASGQATVSVPNASTNVTLTVINIDNGCVVAVNQSNTVTVNPLPTIINVSNNGPVCENGSGQFTITGTPNTRVSYSLNGGVITTVNLNASGEGIVPVSSVTANQTIQLTEIRNLATTCFSTVTNSSTLIVNPLPTASFTIQTPSVCNNVAGQIDFTGTPNAIITITDGTTNYQVTLDSSGNYTGWQTPALSSDTTFTLVDVTSTAGCTRSIGSTGAIIIAPTPRIIGLTYSEELCSGDSLDINFTTVDADGYLWTITLIPPASGGTSFVYNGDETQNMNQVIGLLNDYQQGEVLVSITPTSSSGLCQGQTVNIGTDPSYPAIYINPVPQIDLGISSATTAVCTGDTISVTANSSYAGLGVAYHWYADLTGVSTSGSISGISTNGEVILPVEVTNTSQAGTVTFHFTPVLGNCTGAEETITITVNPNPVKLLLVSGSSYEICSGDTVASGIPSISLESGSVAGTIIHWQAQDIYNVDGADVTVEYQSSVSPVNVTDILSVVDNSEQGYVRYKFWTTLGDCMGVYQYLTVYVNPLPEPVLEDSALCVEQIGGTVFQITHLNAGDFSGGNYQFRWYKVDTAGDVLIATFNNNSSIEIDEPGDYYVVVSNLNTTCSSVSNTVTVYETVPANSITTTVTDAFSDNATIAITITGGTNGTYLYQLDEGSLEDSNIFTGVSAGEHLVTVVDTQGCTFLQETVMVIDYPKYFTPNGDGINDTWNISGLDQNTTKLYIFDRYGKLVKQISPNGNGWDGTYNGRQLPSTDYWFSLQYEENGVAKEFRAHFSLKR